MNRLVPLGLVALTLAACSREPSPSTSPDAAAPPVPASAPVAEQAPQSAQPTPAPSQGPSFDCNQARSDAETMVCNDAELAALDRRLADLYRGVQTRPDELDIAAEQHGWIKGRDACWRAVDPRRCLQEAYQTRIVELQLDAMSGPGPAPVRFVCEGSDKPLSVTWFNDLEPQAARVQLGKDQALVFAAPSASGARYTREGVEFWEHQGEATLEFYGTRLSCRKQEA